MIMPSVSIIIPVYNVKEYLSECLESVINQTYRNLEILLVDDGSTDGSSEICDAYAVKDNRIKVIHKTNGGLSDARNKGIELASSEYISFLDSDDVLSLDFFNIMVSYVINENADIVECDYFEFIDTIHHNNFDATVKIKTGMQALYDLYRVTSKNIIAWGKIYRKKLFDEIRYPVGKYHEDVFTTYKLFYFAEKVVHLNMPLYYYRKRKGSITSVFCKKRLDILEACYESNEFFLNHNIDSLIKDNWKMGIGYCFDLNLFDSEYKKDIYNHFKYFYRQYKKIQKPKYGFIFEFRTFIFNISPSFDCFLVRIYKKFFHFLSEAR